MDKITFKNVMPKVFSTIQELDSEVWGKDITFRNGQLYLIEAASGKGKSTFCSYISGYRHDYTGQILFDDSDIKFFSSSKWAKFRQRNISLLFQELRLFPELTAFENVMIKNQLTNHVTTDTIMSWFERLNIPEKAHQQLGKMSFGQQQRVAMMRAIAQPFDILLADEPISHLDNTNARIMSDIMMEEAHRQNACVIVTSIGKHVDLNYDEIVKL